MESSIGKTEKTIKEIKRIAEEKQQKEGIQIQGVNILFLDVSSTCTGYTIAHVDFTNKAANITKLGAIWLGDSWEHAEKYCYMYNAITNYFWIIEQIDHIIVEQYSINPKRMVGVNVVPELLGVIKCAGFENGVKTGMFLPQSWRSELGIKKDKENNDWKVPTKKAILEYIDIPERSISNITGNERRTPFDVYDSAGVCIGWLKRHGINKIKAVNTKFNNHIEQNIGSV